MVAIQLPSSETHWPEKQTRSSRECSARTKCGGSFNRSDQRIPGCRTTRATPYAVESANDTRRLRISAPLVAASLGGRIGRHQGG